MQWYARICFVFAFIAIPAGAMICKDMSCIHIHCHSCWCNDSQGYVLYWHSLPFLLMHTYWTNTYWRDAYWMDTYWTNTYWRDLWWRGTLLNGYLLKRYMLKGYVFKRYVWNGAYWNAWYDIHQQTFWRTVRRNVFRKKLAARRQKDEGLLIHWLKDSSTVTFLIRMIEGSRSQHQGAVQKTGQSLLLFPNLVCQRFSPQLVLVNETCSLPHWGWMVWPRIKMIHSQYRWVSLGPPYFPSKTCKPQKGTQKRLFIWTWITDHPYLLGVGLPPPLKAFLKWFWGGLERSPLEIISPT